MLSRRIIMIDENTVEKNGLVGYWHYQAGISGTTWSNIAPNTAGLYNGTITGAVLQSNGVFFDGINDDVTTAALPAATSWTLELGFKYDGTSTSQGVVMGWFPNGFAGGNWAALQVNYGAAANRFVMYDSATNALGIKVESILTPNVFYHVAIRFDRITPFPNDRSLNYYLNGQYMSTASVNATSMGGQLMFGRRKFNTSFFDPFKGTLAFARVYDRPLTDTELGKNYLVGFALGL